MTYWIEAVRGSDRVATIAETASVAISTLDKFQKAGFSEIVVKDSDGELIDPATLIERAKED